MSRTPHEYTTNDICGRWRYQAEAPFKQRVLGSNPSTAHFPLWLKGFGVVSQPSSEAMVS